MKTRSFVGCAAILAATAGLAHAQSFTEDFETTTAGTYPATWTNHNQSSPGPGLVTWNVQNPGGVFAAHGGTGMLSVNYNSGTGLSTLSNWLIMPAVTLNNGDTFTFWAQTNPAQIYPDRLQLRMSTAGTSDNTGASATDVGDFTNLLIDINPTLTTTGFPGTWTQFSATVSGLGGPTVGRFAFRYFVENGGPSGANSDYIGVDDVVYTATGGGPVGACCIPSNLSCAILSPSSCTSQSGTYRGDGTTCATANCPTPGACCLALGTCSQLAPAACTAQSGIYRGDSTSCATANCPGGFTMNCNATATFTDISATGTPITTGDDSSAAFTSSVTNALVTNPTLYACTNGFITDSATFTAFTNTALPVAGVNFGLFPNWDDLYIDTALVPPGSLVHQAVVENGVNVEIIQWNLARTFVTQTPVTQGSFQVKIFGSGPVLAQYIYQNMGWDWNGNSSTVGVQWGPTAFFQKQFLNNNATPTPPFPIPDNSACSITQTGLAACYANCDSSTTQPCLNVLDFGCFLNKFAAGDTYANCDNSTTVPVLNVLDFGCFLNKFAAGCSSC